MPTCTDTDGPIQPAGTLSAVAQCAGCYLEGNSGPCPTWEHYLQAEEPSEPSHPLPAGTQVIVATWDGGERSDTVKAYHANIKRGMPGYDLDSSHSSY